MQQSSIVGTVLCNCLSEQEDIVFPLFVNIFLKFDYE